MKRTITAFATVLTVSIGLTGCSEDNCVDCPTQSDPDLFAIGTAVMEDTNTLAVAIDIFNTAGTDRGVDTAFADDEQLCVRAAPYSTPGDGHQVVRTLGGELCPSGALPSFTAGDTTRFEFYCDGELHFAEFHLLDAVTDAPRNLTATADSAAGTLDIGWNPVGDAEWYSIKLRSKFNFAGPWIWEYYVVDSNSVTVDLPIPYAQINDVRIYVAAATGAKPGGSKPEHNVSGVHMKGSLYSVTNEAYFYLELTPLPVAQAVTVGEWINPPPLLEMMR
jgi:hypothetical protein